MAANASETTAPMVLGYYPSWAGATVAPAKMDFSALTHICHAFILPNANGSLRTEGNMPSRELCDAAHAMGARVLISLGGANSHERFTSMTSQRATQDAFVRNVMQVLRENEYDGIDLDWEVPTTTATMNALTNLALDFRTALDGEPGERKLITMALSGSAWSMKYIDAHKLKDTVDFINIMSYDVHGKWNDHGGHNAPLHHNPDTDRRACEPGCGAEMVAYFRNKCGWPANRLLLGIPLYGREFPCAKPNEASDKTMKVNDYVACHEVPKYLADGWTPRRDDVACVPYLLNPNGKTFLSYEDEQSAAYKGKWAREQGLAGVFFWEITQDTQPALPVVRAAGKAMNGQ